MALKKPYEKPVLIDLNKNRIGLGDYDCEPGSNADSLCSTNGNSADETCSSDGIAAELNCFSGPGTGS